MCKLGGTVDDSEMVDGMVFDQKAAKSAGGPTKVENAKIALIQFHVSPPKSDLENNIIISDYAQVTPADSAWPPQSSIFDMCVMTCMPFTTLCRCQDIMGTEDMCPALTFRPRSG